MKRTGSGATRIAYVMTNYPFPSQTFLMEEVLGVSGEAFDVVPIAINPTVDGDVLTTEHQHEHDRTFYVKGQSKVKILATLARFFGRHPVAATGLAARVVKSGGANIKVGAWRFFHFVEGVLVWDYCHRNNVSHIHAQFGGLPAAVAMYAADVGTAITKKAPLSWSYTVHGFHDFVNENEIRLDVKTHSATFVVGISDFTASQLMRIADPMDWSKIHVVRCGIELQRFPRRVAVPVPAIPTIVTVGRLSAEKGHVVLLQAMRQLADRGVQTKLRLIGSGPYQDEIEHEITRLGLSGQVELLGMRPSHEVAEELRCADVFCLPSFAEGVPISIMEAMAVGVPVVSTNVGGISELLTHELTGWCVAPGRCDQLADALQQALTPGNDLNAVLDAARSRVEQLHNNATMVAQMRVLFEQYVR